VGDSIWSERRIAGLEWVGYSGCAVAGPGLRFTSKLK
jgi:hypothetical protein